MTALARGCRGISSRRARAWAASDSSSVSTRYLPARTSVTDSKPSACSPPLMVRPAGSLTTGFSVTKISARYLMCALPRRNRKAAQRLQITGAGARDHFVGERRRRRLLVPAQLFQVITQVLLVERGLRTARPVLLKVPEARGIRRHHLVDEDHVPIVPPKLEFRIRKDEAVLEGPFGSESVEREAEPFEGFRQLAAGPIRQFGP